MNILSLFGGIETGLIALKELGIKIDDYYSSEIDKYASSVARYNHPEIIELGDILNYKNWNLPKIDLVFAGFPCQGFSIAGLGLDWSDPRSQLFFTAVEILWDIQKQNPKVKFLFENVASMKKDIRAEIDELMEVDHIMINSALVSAQNRKRNYWCNWNVVQPEDKGLLLKDIIEDDAPDFYKPNPELIKNYKGGNRLNPNYKSQSNMVFDENEKMGTLCANTHGYALGHIVFTEGLEKGRRLHDGKNLSRNFREGYRIHSDQGKTPSLTAKPKGGPGGYSGLFETKKIIRKLMPTECERLQTLPDNTTAQGINEKGELVKISNTQRYKCTGNGWTKDAIKHILQGATMG